MVSCEPFQSYKVALKNCEQSIIEHNLVTIYLNLEWPPTSNENPNLLIHIREKKIAPKICKTETSMPYVSTNPSALLVNSLHQQQQQQQQHFPSVYQQQYYHQAPLINNDSSTAVITSADHNDVSSTTTNVVFNPLQAPSSTISPPLISIVKGEVKPSNSPTSSSNPSCVVQTSPTLKSISPISTQLIDVKPSAAVAAISSYPLSTTSSSSTFKAFACSCLKSHHAHEQNCPAWNVLIKPSLTSPTLVCRPAPPSHRSLAQRAAVASQIRSNRTISMTPSKEQGQPSAAISTGKPTELSPILSQQQQTSTNLPLPNYATIRKPIARQRSIGVVNVRAKKRRIIKQISLPNGSNVDGSFFTPMNLNDASSSQQQQKGIFTIKEEQTSPTNTIIKSPRKLFSPFSAHSIQTTISNLEIDQTIDEVINGKGDINVSDLPPAPPQPQAHPSSQLVWVQNGTVTTKTWLSPLYQKQQQQQQQQQQLSLPATYDPHGSTLTHQDVVNIAQQVVFPTANELNKGSTVVVAPVPGGSKRRTRSKSTTTSATPKRNRNRKHPPNRAHSITSNNQDSTGKATVITPTSNLISKPIVWPQTSTASSAGPSSLIGDKNELWPGQGMENVDTMLDEFQLVSIDEQRMHANHQFDFDLSIDGFSSKTSDRFGASTPPPPLTHDHHHRYALAAVGEKFPHPFAGHGKLTGGDVDVYEHFLNPLPVSSSSIWQEDQVTSSVSTPPDFQPTHFPRQQQQTQQAQQYYPSLSDEPFDHLHSQVRLLFDVQS